MKIDQRTVGYYGKIPLHGDFIKRNIMPSFEHQWDQWMEAALSNSRIHLNNDWINYYLSCPFWRFYLSAGVIDNNAWLGVWAPSVDSVGRYFPIVIAIPVAPEVSGYAAMSEASRWFSEVEALIGRALNDEIDADALQAELLNIDGLDVSPQVNIHNIQPSPFVMEQSTIGVPSYVGVARLYEATLRQTLPSFSLWYTTGSEHLKPVMLTTKGLPDLHQFTALLTQQWQAFQWQVLYTPTQQEQFSQIPDDIELMAPEASEATPVEQIPDDILIEDTMSDDMTQMDIQGHTLLDTQQEEQSPSIESEQLVEPIEASVSTSSANISDMGLGITDNQVDVTEISDDFLDQIAAPSTASHVSDPIGVSITDHTAAEESVTAAVFDAQADTPEPPYGTEAVVDAFANEANANDVIPEGDLLDQLGIKNTDSVDANDLVQDAQAPLTQAADDSNDVLLDIVDAYDKPNVKTAAPVSTEGDTKELNPAQVAAMVKKARENALVKAKAKQQITPQATTAQAKQAVPTQTKQQLVGAAITDQGSVRDHNEDSIYADDAKSLWVVADGMGGHMAGDRASQMIVQAMENLTIPAQSTTAAQTSLYQAVMDIDQQIKQVGEQEYHGRTLGSTIVGMYVNGDEGLCFWAGDSRLYAFNEQDQLLPISRDHSHVNALIDMVELTPEEAENYPHKNVITRAVGAIDGFEPEFKAFNVQADTIYLLCSDGLYGAIPEEVITEVLQGAQAQLATLADAMLKQDVLRLTAQKLIDLSLAAEAKDNVSVILTTLA